MATKGFFTKRTTETGYILFNFNNNLDVAEVILTFDIAVVDSEGTPAPSVLGSSSIVASGTKVQVWVQAGDDGETYTYTVDAHTSEGGDWTLEVDMAVDDNATYEDQLVTLLAAISQAALETTAQSIKDKTDTLPSSPAATGEYNSALSTIQSDLNNPDQYKADVSAVALETSVQAVKGKTDNLPGDPASQSDVETAITNTEEAIAEDIQLLQATADSIETKATAIQAKTDTIAWDDIDFIRAIEGGRWDIVGHQMIFYDSDNTTEVAKFNLYTKDGKPTDDMSKVYERRRV